MLQLGAESADAYYTKRDMGPWFHEYNPTARQPFPAFFIEDAALKLGASYLLHRMHHHKLERVFQVIAIGDSCFGAAFSASHYNQ